MLAMLDILVLEGSVTIIALAVLGLEIVALIAMARTRRPTADLIANALSGVFLILALRAALIGSGTIAIAAFLGLAFVAHVVGVLSRLRL
jgi:hypothetical protein